MVEYIIPSSLEDALQVVGDASHSLNHLCSLENGNDKETREE